MPRRCGEAATELGWDVIRLPSWRVPEELRSVPDPVLYLEALFGPIVPNVTTSLIVVATFAVPLMIVLEASLSFLGMGVPPSATQRETL